MEVYMLVYSKILAWEPHKHHIPKPSMHVSGVPAVMSSHPFSHAPTSIFVSQPALTHTCTCSFGPHSLFSYAASG